MASRDKSFRIAIRSFGPFESAIAKQWRTFNSAENTGMELDPVPLDLHPLHKALFEDDGLSRGDWDLAFISTDWIAEASCSGSLMDLSDLLAEDAPDDYPAAWPKSLLRMQSIDGKILGMPYHDGPECLIYRTDLIPEPDDLPRTWAEFRDVAKRLNRVNENLYGTVFAAYPDGHNTVYDFCLQLWSRGGELFTSSGAVQLRTAEAADALRYYRSIVNDTSAVHPACRDFDSVKSGFAFAAGEIAMMVNWFGFAAMSQTLADSRVRGRVGIGRVPCQGGPHTSLNAYWILGIAAGSKSKDLAWRFLKHCASSSMDKLLTTEGGIGCRLSTWRDPDINRSIPFYHELEKLHQDARELPRLPYWAQLSGIVDELVLRALNSNVSERDLLVDAQSKAEQLIATVR